MPSLESMKELEITQLFPSDNSTLREYYNNSEWETLNIFLIMNGSKKISLTYFALLHIVFTEAKQLCL